MAKCLICGKEADTLRTAVKNGQYISERCDRCLNSFGGFADGARAFERKWQQRHYAKDTIQSWEPEYIKAYGAGKAREAGWSEDAIRRYG